MPDPATPQAIEPIVPVQPADPAPAAPPEPTEEQRNAEIFAAAEAEAAIENGVKPPDSVEEPAPPGDPANPNPPPVPETPADPAAPVDPAAEPVDPDAGLTDEQKLERQDEADAKALGFKNQRASEEFKAQRKELRELRPLKELVEQIEPAAQKWGQMMNYWEANRITADQFGVAMKMVAGLNSQDPNILSLTREGLLKELKAVNARLGEAGAGYDPLSEPANADLARRVEQEGFDVEAAHEIARLRARDAAIRKAHEDRQQEFQRTQQDQGEHAQAISALNALGEEFKALDPRYEEKAAILVPILKPVYAGIPPREWAAKFREAYLGLKLPDAPAAPARPAPLRNQPLRPTPTARDMGRPLETQNDVFEAAMQEAARVNGVAYR